MTDQEHLYDQDGLTSYHNHEFMNEGWFQAAYARGVKATGLDYNWHWRAYIGLWVARNASKLEGDFVECGVAKGFLSSAIMQMLNWDKIGKTFFLLDTFNGIDERFVSPVEMENGAIAKNTIYILGGLYPTRPDEVIANFSEWRNVEIIVGAVPETLDKITSDKVAYLHLDMNCAPPEVAAITYLWDRLTDGALVLMDDYAYTGYRPQKTAMDHFAASKQTMVLSLPTGQGLLLKPPR